MRSIGLLFALQVCFSISGCTPDEEKKDEGLVIISFDQLEENLNKPSQKMKVVNFWATWCKPCIKEMPYFEKVAKKHSDQMDLIFVSLDFPDEVDKVKSFLLKKDFQSATYLLNETNYDDFMPRIDKSWTGAIPATLFVDQQEKKYFYEKSFTEAELDALIISLL